MCELYLVSTRLRIITLLNGQLCLRRQARLTTPISIPSIPVDDMTLVESPSSFISLNIGIELENTEGTNPQPYFPSNRESIRPSSCWWAPIFCVLSGPWLSSILLFAAGDSPDTALSHSTPHTRLHHTHSQVWHTRIFLITLIFSAHTHIFHPHSLVCHHTHPHC